MTDLVFDFPASTSGDLVFGDFDPTGPLIETHLAAAIAGPGLVALAKRVGAVHLDAAIPLPGLSAVGAYQSQTQRPLVGTTRAHWQDGAAIETGSAAGHQQAQPTPVGVRGGFARAAALPAATVAPWADAIRRGQSRSAAWREANPVAQAPHVVRWQEMGRQARASRAAAWGPGVSLGTQRETSWQERHRNRRPAVDVPWGQGQQVQRAQSGRIGPGVAIHTSRAVPWGPARRPPPGVRPPVVPPGVDPCYIPDGHLVFSEAWAAFPHLVLYCELHDDVPLPPATVVVPVRRVYMTINDVFLTRVVGNVLLPTLSLRLNIDADSWTWTFSATLESWTLEYLQPIDDEPIELEASINGEVFRLVAESLKSDREHARSRITIGGRGKNARLADQSIIQTFSASEIRNASQLMDEALMVNGVSIGWSVDWGLEDWLVPGGVWSHQGTHISALQAIAEAAGAYLQPHRTDDQIRVLHRYPVVPWEWAGETPDFELPAAVTLQEGIEWVDRPRYNRVFVAGTRDGILAQVTRAGTAGDVLAPMVVHPLTTAAAAGRQRGRAILGNTGRQAGVSLRLPVLTETGVIEPGAMVRYLDGVTPRTGLVRSTSIDASPQTVRQVLGIETHVA